MSFRIRSARSPATREWRRPRAHAIALHLSSLAFTLIVAPLAAEPAPQPVAGGGSAAVQPAQAPKFDIMDWTPRPAVGKGEPWELMTDPQWDRDLVGPMDTGPFYQGVLRYPHAGRQVLVPKGVAVMLGADAAVVFDRATLRWAAAWTGGRLKHSARRFSLLNTPSPADSSRMLFSTASGAGWADKQGRFAAVPLASAPLPGEWGRFLGLHLRGERVVFRYEVQGVLVLDTVRLGAVGGQPAIVRTLWVDRHEQPLKLRVDDQRAIELPAADQPRTHAVMYGAQGHGGEDSAPVEDIEALVKPGGARWGAALETKLERGEESGPFAVDTLTLPYENPFRSPLFCTGLDFLPDGRIAVAMCHGDVWLAKPDEASGRVSWRRFATGLNHPLGLRVVDGKVVVLEGGQLTRLHDINADGEADTYECLSLDWHTGTGEHAYDTCLETTPGGDFVFFKTGDTHLPHGGCLLRVPATGGAASVLATGFRHPIGLGMSPTGVITGADQEGNWMPATRIDEYRAGGFYGDMRAHHRDQAPATYDGPLCWLPREVDNSAGGQVWVPAQGKGAWAASPLAGLPIHLSYGRCRAFVLLRQTLPDGTVQGGVSPLPLQFLSGSARGRFGPDGDLYVCGLNGWQTAARADGSVQRVRLTGKPLHTVTAARASTRGVQLTFSQPLDPSTATNPVNYKAAAWNYRWSKDYGSARWKPSDPQRQGQDEWPVAAATLLDERSVLLQFKSPVLPVMQLQLGYRLTTRDGTAISGPVFLTVRQAPAS